MSSFNVTLGCFIDLLLVYEEHRLCVSVKDSEMLEVLLYNVPFRLSTMDNREFLEKRYSVSESAGQSGRIFCVNPSSA